MFLRFATPLNPNGNCLKNKHNMLDSLSPDAWRHLNMVRNLSYLFSKLCWLRYLFAFTDRKVGKKLDIDQYLQWRLYFNITFRKENANKYHIQNSTNVREICVSTPRLWPWTLRPCGRCCPFAGSSWPSRCRGRISSSSSGSNDIRRVFVWVICVSSRQL